MNVLYLCGGIGMFAQAIAADNLIVAHHTDVEIDATSRGIASKHHNIDHTTLPQDLTQVTHAHLADLKAKYGRIDLVIATTPCQGLSSANKNGTGLQDPRSALFRHAIDIICHLLSEDEDLLYIAENVDFRSAHPQDYQEVCAALGTPDYIDAKHTSGSNRKRLFWHNLPGKHAAEQPHPIDANTLLRPGCTLAYGATTAPCIMASWRCAHKKCKRLKGTCNDYDGHIPYQFMNTQAPVVVYQDGCPRHLLPDEAERLMGLPTDYTATTADGQPVPAMQRLIRLGGGIDLRSVRQLIARIPHPRSIPHDPREHTDTHIGHVQHTVHDHVKPHTQWNTANIAKWITPGPLPTAKHYGAPEGDPGAWHHSWHLEGAEDLVRCCTQGFPLRYEGDRENDVEDKNGKTCLEHPDITANELQKEVASGHILGPYNAPPLPGFKCTPRGLKEEPTKFRPITMGNLPIDNSVNDGIPKMDHIHLARACDIERKISAAYASTGQVWMATADVKQAYRTMPVRPEDWHLQGIAWDGQYYIDARMSFGCRSSVDQWLRFSDALAWTLLRWGVHALHYVDDFIFIASSEQECADQVRKFKAICASWNVELKEQSDCGPARRITVLGVEYDLVNMKRKITQTRVAQLDDLLQRATTDRDRALWEKLTGILWYVIRCAPIGTPHLQRIMETTIRARAQRKPAMPTAAALEAIAWWQAFMHTTRVADGSNTWHGESLIPTKHTTATVTAMGDAGSEWGIGGHDSHSYFKAPWTTELWSDVQRNASSSSLHMEAIQLLVMTRIMAPSWQNTRVIIELDSLGLVHTYNKGRHKHPAINAILAEISSLQIKHDITIDTRWIRRCHNEAADALSKDDMPRFWKNIQGGRTQIIVTPHDLRRPAHYKTGGMRRTGQEQAAWDARPTKRIAPYITAAANTTALSLKHQIAKVTAAHDDEAEPLHATRSGVKHYLRFCTRTDRHHDVAPNPTKMADNILHWMADAVHTYHDPTTGKTKRALSTTSIPTYLCQIDHWYSATTRTPRSLLQKDERVSRHRKLITAHYKSARRQVHGITYERLELLIHNAQRLDANSAATLTAAYSLAWFAMLRPTEYMLTPQHSKFDPTRHLRAGDVKFWRAQQEIRPGSTQRPTYMTVNIKQSKTDSMRLGANLIIGSTTTATCPVSAVWNYMNLMNPEPTKALFPGLKYPTMLRTTRLLLGKDAELYGLHSLRVGGAQALALSGRSVAYIMAKGRWKNIESVTRYVEVPDDIKTTDSAAMARTQAQRAHGPQHYGYGQQHTLPERESLLPQYPRNWKQRAVC